jgi:glutathione S-transferase
MTLNSPAGEQSAAEAALTLWGTPHSLYTGKVRSYLIKKGIPFRESFPHHPRYKAEVVPAVRLVVVPIVETSDGKFYQDTSDIIAELERRFPAAPVVPTTPLQRIVARLLDGYGSECLLPAAMHYRWSYRQEQEHFLQAEFGRAMHCGPDREARLKAGAQFMDYFNGFLPPLGVVPETIPAIEAAYEELLDLLDIHFQHHPYLLGGRPCIADFGFMAPLFAHLGRDPVPAALMMKRAPNVYRWTERMNRAQIADGEFPDHAEAWLPDDAIPPTLEPVLRLMFQDWGAQLCADAKFVNAWLQANPALPAGQMISHNGERTVHPVLGMIEYPWRGVSMQRASMPQGLWHFEQAASEARALSGPAQKNFKALVDRLGGGDMMQVKLVRPLVRQDYVLVLG